MGKQRVNHFYAVIIIALLAIVAYLPTFRQPLIEDDYPNIRAAREYGAVSSWPSMYADEVNRVRATSFVLMYWNEWIAGLWPPAFYGSSIFLHILNCLILYSFGRWEVVGFRVSAFTAAFFAVQEGHQEAIMWYSACNELLMFLFGMLALYCWLRSLDAPKKSWAWYLTSVLLFVLALLSKESAVIFLPLFGLSLYAAGFEWRKLLRLAPFSVLAGIVVLSILMTSSQSFRFTDHSFELSAPFWITWSKSFVALFWFWGVLAVFILVLKRKYSRLLLFALMWTSISFIPYMFVAYIQRIPSRQTYLASAGLALVVGAAIVTLRDMTRAKYTWVFGVLLSLIVAHNIGYLWLRKHGQFLERGRPTEELIAFARDHEGQFYVTCFPRDNLIADSALLVALNKPVGTINWRSETIDDQESQQYPTFCFKAAP